MSPPGGPSLGFFGQTNATIRDSKWEGYVAVRDGSSATFARNEVIGDTFSGSAAGGAGFDGGGAATASGNVLRTTEIGISISGADPLIEDNTIQSDQASIMVVAGSAPTITGNSIDAGGRGVVVGSGTALVVSGNVVCSDEVSLYIGDRAEPQIEDNDICAETTAK